MDYTEGLLLGKLWSDTDYENRSHAGLFILYGLLTDVIVLYNFLMKTFLMGLGKVTTLEIVLLSLLVVACPFICFRYYRMPIWGKLLVLAEKFFKAFLVTDISVMLMLRVIPIKPGELQDYLMDYLNNTLEDYTDKFAGKAGSFATVMGVIVGGVHTVLIAVLILAAAVLIPGMVFMTVRYLQYAYDWMIERVVLRRFFRYRK